MILIYCVLSPGITQVVAFIWDLSWALNVWGTRSTCLWTRSSPLDGEYRSLRHNWHSVTFTTFCWLKTSGLDQRPKRKQTLVLEGRRPAHIGRKWEPLLTIFGKSTTDCLENDDYYYFTFWATPQHMKFLGQGSGLSHSCNHDNARSFNPLCWARGWTCVLVLQRHYQSHWAAVGTRNICFDGGLQEYCDLTSESPKVIYVDSCKNEGSNTKFTTTNHAIIGLCWKPLRS